MQIWEISLLKDVGGGSGSRFFNGSVDWERISEHVYIGKSVRSKEHSISLL